MIVNMYIYVCVKEIVAHNVERCWNATVVYCDVSMCCACARACSSYFFFLPRSIFQAIKWCLDDECNVTECVKADFFPVCVCERAKEYMVCDIFAFVSRFSLVAVGAFIVISIGCFFCCSFTPVLLWALLRLLLFKSMVISLNLMRCIPNHQSVCVCADFNSKIWAVKFFVLFFFHQKYTRTPYHTCTTSVDSVGSQWFGVCSPLNICQTGDANSLIEWFEVSCSSVCVCVCLSAENHARTSIAVV